jgi:hypothetical protein
MAPTILDMSGSSNPTQRPSLTTKTPARIQARSEPFYAPCV